MRSSGDQHVRKDAQGALRAKRLNRRETNMKVANSKSN